MLFLFEQRIMVAETKGIAFDHLTQGYPFAFLLGAKKMSVKDHPALELHNLSISDGLAKKLRQEDLFRASQEDISWASIEEILESMNIGVRRKFRKPKKKGRKKGSKNKSSPEVTRKLGDATLHYSCGRYEEAISVLFEVVRLAPNLPDPFHILGAVFNAIGERKKALNCYMLAAHMTPKDSSLWKCLVDWSLEQGNSGQAMYCLSKAITADPDDIDLRKYRASLYIDRGDLQKAAVSYEQISRLCPDNVEAVKSAVKLYQKCGQIERSSMILEKYIVDHPVEADLTVVDLLAAICIAQNEYGKALHHIEHAQLVYFSGKELPLHLTIKAGVCHIYLGNIEKAEYISCSQPWHFMTNALENGILAYTITFLVTKYSDNWVDNIPFFEKLMSYPECGWQDRDRATETWVPLAFGNYPLPTSSESKWKIGEGRSDESLLPNRQALDPRHVELKCCDDNPRRFPQDIGTKVLRLNGVKPPNAVKGTPSHLISCLCNRLKPWEGKGTDYLCRYSVLPLKCFTLEEATNLGGITWLKGPVVLFKVLQGESAKDHVSFIIEAADAFMKVDHCEYALKYLLALDERAGDNDGVVHLQIAHSLTTLGSNISARVTLATLLVEEDRVDDAISLLSPATNSGGVVFALLFIDLPILRLAFLLLRLLYIDPAHDTKSEILKPWWLSGEVKLKLSEIYKAKGMLKDFVDAIFPLVHESLFIESIQQKVKARKKLPRSVLLKRAEMLEDHETDNIFHGFRPVATPSDRLKATRAKKSLQKKAALKEEKKAAVQAAGFEWCSDDSDDEPPKTDYLPGSFQRQALKEPPLPNLLKDEEQHCLIVDLSKVLTSLQRHSEALEIINLTLRLPHNKLSADKREELRALGAQIAYNNIIDPMHGFDCVRYIVHQHPYSLSAWNCYYKVTSRLENRYSKHCKFLRRVRGRYKDCVPPIVISGHQFAAISQHQTAAREYLEAYKLMPENPLINLCAGSSLINLALGFRLQNKHQCLVQGLAFLYNNLQLSEHSQEALYNIARALHHVGLYSLAVSYYEQVLTTTERDYPIPKLPNENPDIVENLKPGYCSLRREAAYNLHLIYKKSGALDLARQAQNIALAMFCKGSLEWIALEHSHLKLFNVINLEEVEPSLYFLSKCIIPAFSNSARVTVTVIF
ncbi:Tetratricopeptide repeat [Dillenia turbinata]|uniref:Tetratricopeptide repeat n=1 Tax=Dillenia turbinata TaxID=194707 RepID=A0AAN8UMU0_9MAGN